MARSEVERLDPQQRILLEVARECIDDAGDMGVKQENKNVGVYVGSFGNDWYDIVQTETQRYGIYQVATTHDFALSNRISYEMDLKGPRCVVLPLKCDLSQRVDERHGKYHKLLCTPLIFSKHLQRIRNTFRSKSCGSYLQTHWHFGGVDVSFCFKQHGSGSSSVTILSVLFIKICYIA